MPKLIRNYFKTDKSQNIKNKCSAMSENYRIAIRELSEECSISNGSVQSILREESSMRRVFAKFVPKLLPVDQKEDRLKGALDLLESAEND
ncbi:hypothetical protein AVEN_103208-1 [Araneus ventricosus]|uniref:HTH psq-type domain-containing protein n=1 Tax=Araneus ventricosus TaxID=182803 RepID=A0A4Y2F6W5_ARAVE|nr:hypothetical protein AVEN_103208-1 [Araneus ventricosus]